MITLSIVTSEYRCSQRDIARSPRGVYSVKHGRLTSLRLLILVAAFAATALPALAREALPQSPAERFGALFEAVQMARIFPDGKTFVDAVPKRPDADILADWQRDKPADDTALRAFIEANFDVPDSKPAPPPSQDRPPIRDHIRALWPVLTRAPDELPPGSSLLALPKPYVVPGGRFREMYYWDSYFTMLGLARDGRDDLIESMIDDFGSLIDRYGHIPNGTRSYYLSRSQPPMFFLMVGLSKAVSPDVRRRRLSELRREHDFWMAGAEDVKPGSAARRVVRLKDGSLLNRYFDDKASPRDESWREDTLTAQKVLGRPAADVYRDLRASAESGWDFSSRWFADGRTLATIRTISIAPVDLNALLYGLERAIAAACEQQSDEACAKSYGEQARARQRAVRRWMWVGSEDRFADLDWTAGKPTPVLSAATLYPLFTGLASQDEARAVARTVQGRLLAPGGLRTTTSVTGQQWDRPNGWAPLQWIAVSGLRRYGQKRTADAVATRFLTSVAREYCASGRMLEKYDVDEAKPGGGGEYPLQDGFGWTNGVTAELIASTASVRAQAEKGEASPRPADITRCPMVMPSPTMPERAAHPN
jgi:alpha,alpha-trehalase